MVYATVIVTFLQELHFLSCLRVSKPTSCPTTSTSCLCKLAGMFLTKVYWKGVHYCFFNLSEITSTNCPTVNSWFISNMTDRYFTPLDSVCGTGVLLTKIIGGWNKSSEESDLKYELGRVPNTLNGLLLNKKCLLIASFRCSFELSWTRHVIFFDLKRPKQYSF